MIRRKPNLLHHHETPFRGDFLFYNEEKGVRMDFEKIKATVKEKAGLTDEQCQKVGEIFAGNFNPADENNRATMVGLLKDKVKLDDDKANKVYDAVVNACSSLGDVASGAVESIKGFFNKK